MRINYSIKSVILWIALVSICFSASNHLHQLMRHGGPDPTSVDEQQMRYPALDIENICNQAQNPKCEAVIDNFCIKSCSAQLCSEHGSIRGMCRLMCESEDLPPQCLKMGPTKVIKKDFLYPYGQLNQNQNMVLMNNSMTH